MKEVWTKEDFGRLAIYEIRTWIYMFQDTRLGLEEFIHLEEPRKCYSVASGSQTSMHWNDLENLLKHSFLSSTPPRGYNSVGLGET